MFSFAQMKDRKLVQWGLAYLAGAWLLLQLVQLLGEMYAWPATVTRVVPPLLVVGFFAALVLAWYHGEKGEQRIGAVELLMLTGILVVAGGVLALLNARGGVGAAEAAGAEDGAADAAAADTAAAASTLPALAVPEQGSIAVLPFVDMSAAGDQEYFADGLAEELLNALAQLPELRVAARTSSFSFKGTNVPVDSIARVLNVRHVLEGSVRKAKDQVRITAQLIDAETGYHAWSQTYDAELANIFAVQDSISRAIVAALRIELGDGRGDGPLVKEETANPEAHLLLLRAEHAMGLSTREGVAQAERLFREALALDPDYARAHAGLALVSWYGTYSGWNPVDEGYGQAEQEARRALALDSGQANAHIVLAQIAGDRDWNWDAADAHYLEAIEARPGYARAYSWRAILLARIGRTEAAIASGKRAVALDPVSPGAVNNLGFVYGAAGRPEQALEHYQTALTLAPGHPLLLLNLAFEYSGMGRYEEALQAVERAVEAAPDDGTALSSLGYVQARAGKRAEAERTLEKLQGMPGASPYQLATVHAGLGEREKVFILLDQAVAERDPRVVDLGGDNVFDPFRDDPRMRALLDRMGLP